MKISIVLPTYNESDNIGLVTRMITEVLHGKDYEIMVVDDNSPDGTAEIARRLGQYYPIKVIKRSGKLGLGTAIIEGFCKSSGDIMGVIDADMQHPPELIPELISALQDGYDIAIASRYISGGGVEGWSFFRRLTSKVATMLARPLVEIKDPMSGFFLIRRSVFEHLTLGCTGYKILLEILANGDYSAKEIPYVFQPRKYNKSKLDAREYYRYLKLLLNLYTKRSKSVLSRARAKEDSV
jgi:dolichol-phosphate mannosyltransferase